MQKIVFATFLLFFAGSLTVYYFIQKRIIDTINRSSSVLKQLKAINNEINYHPVKEKYFHSYCCTSRAEYNHFLLDNYFLEIVGNDQKIYHQIINAIEHNKKEKARYDRKLKNIDYSHTMLTAKEAKIPLSIYQKYQTELYKKMLLQEPITEIAIVCRKEYTTPAGRTHIWSDSTYHYKELVRFYKEAEKVKEQRKIRRGQIEYERALMTPSMRYEILKRDGFRCRLCGSTAQDGVKLHIDHIVPVSKGGHTVPENLRVLCDRCNLGKSDKIE